MLWIMVCTKPLYIFWSQRCEARQHAAGQTWTPEADRLWYLHAHGRGMGCCTHLSLSWQGWFKGGSDFLKLKHNQNLLQQKDRANEKMKGQ